MYWDTIGYSARRRFPAELLREIGATAGKIIPRICRDGHDPKTTWRYVLIVHQPSKWALKRMQQYKQDEDASLNLMRSDPAFDFDPIEGSSRDDVLALVNNNRAPRRQRSDARTIDHHGTLYSFNQNSERPSRIDVVYCSKASKLDGTPQTIHTETRMMNARTIRNAGIRDSLDLVVVNPAQIFAGLYAVKQPHSKVLEKTIRKTTRNTQAHYPDQCPDVIERRVRGIFRRQGMDRLSNFIRVFPRQCERLKHWDCMEFDELAYPTLDRGIDQGDGKCGDMFSLLSKPEMGGHPC
jgi:hypothetical protein